MLLKGFISERWKTRREDGDGFGSGRCFDGKTMEQRLNGRYNESTEHIDEGRSSDHGQGQGWRGQSGYFVG